ncbi:hypothetical protein DB346_06560 [Verrucomicrobia bacterium LW23]|nr:hypothetical protein DB346_06560 [Verrucomicrobia bacterium LW23]
MSLLPANIETLSGAARFLFASIAYSLMLLVVTLLIPNTVSLVARLAPFVLLLPLVLLFTALLLWLKDYLLPSLASPSVTRRRMQDALNHPEADSHLPRRSPVRAAIGVTARGAASRLPGGMDGPPQMTRLQQAALLFTSFLVACVVWLSVAINLLSPRMSDYFSERGQLAPVPRAMARAQMARWLDLRERNLQISRLRARNAEWDLMARMYLTLALANVALRDTTMQTECLEVIDTIIRETLEQERQSGQEIFFISSQRVRHSEFLNPGKRSIFVDGEVAMMLAARRLVAEHEPWRDEMRLRVRSMAQQMREAPLFCAETYANVCRTRSNAVALAVLRISDSLDGTDHGPFIRAWVGRARVRLIDPRNQLLVSRFDYTDRPNVLVGAEGSSLWATTHFLWLADSTLAQDQYKSAYRQLSGNLLGFGYAREWPDATSWPPKPQSTESGALVPLLGASPGSSGQALLAAATFGDTRWPRQLLTSLEFVGFPERRDGKQRYLAGNATGDAIILHALVQGPLWLKVRTTMAPAPRSRATPAPTNAPMATPPVPGREPGPANATNAPALDVETMLFPAVRELPASSQEPLLPQAQETNGAPSIPAPAPPGRGGGPQGATNSAPEWQDLPWR